MLQRRRPSSLDTNSAEPGRCQDRVSDEPLRPHPEYIRANSYPWRLFPLRRARPGPGPSRLEGVRSIVCGPHRWARTPGDGDRDGGSVPFEPGYPQCEEYAKGFRGGLASKAHRLVYHSTLGSRAINKMKQPPDIPEPLAQTSPIAPIEWYLAHKKTPTPPGPP